MSNTAVITSEAGGKIFRRAKVLSQCLVTFLLFYNLCGTLYCCAFSFGHCIVLSVLPRLTASDIPFGILQLFLH
jgi:hypothetical protein